MRSNASSSRRRVFIEKSMHVFSGNYALLGGYEIAIGSPPIAIKRLH